MLGHPTNYTGTSIRGFKEEKKRLARITYFIPNIPSKFKKFITYKVLLICYYTDCWYVIDFLKNTICENIKIAVAIKKLVPMRKTKNIFIWFQEKLSILIVYITTKINHKNMLNTLKKPLYVYTIPWLLYTIKVLFDRISVAKLRVRIKIHLLNIIKNVCNMFLFFMYT